MSRLQEITATVVGERHRFGDCEPYTVILDAALANGSAQSAEEVGLPSRLVLKGKTEEDGPVQHLTYRFYGLYRDYLNQRTGQKEQQFHFQTFVRDQPHGRAGIIKYLSHAPNIGHVLADRLYAKFGSDAVRILREKPEVAAATCDRLSAAGAVEAAEWLDREKGLEDCMIELVDLLEGHGLPKATIKHAVKEYGNRAAQLIRENPYRLMRFRGCGFKRADALYLELGLPAAALKRQALCAWHHVAQNSDGDTWHFRKTIDVGLAGAIAGADVKADKAIELATRGGILALQRTAGVNGPPDWDGDCQWLAEEKKANNESRLAAYVCEALAEPADWPDIYAGSFATETLSAHQFMTLDTALSLKLYGPIARRSMLAIMGGSPGTGKTFTAAVMIKLCGEVFGFDQIAAAAPTGKAAVRLSEAMNAYGIPLRARTIHSLLGVMQGEDGGGWSFDHCRTNPLPFKVLVIDEASMIDTDLAASLFAARARGCLVLIIGDVNQLPPVGHGAPLRDMIAAGVPYGELRDIRRNSGEIVQACTSIRDGKAFACGGNLVNVAGRTVDAQRDSMLDTIKRAATLFDVHPVWGVQVVCAVNKKSELSRKDLNKLLQQHLNPKPAVHASPFRDGDKIVNTKNGWYPLVEIAGRSNGRVELADNADDLQINAEGKVYVANGELGEVVLVEPNFMHVRLTSPKRLVVVPRGQVDVNEDAGDEEGQTGTGCNWDLGYVLSVHKSQGSEWPVVVVMVDDSASARRVCSREWLYTSISRAKQCCYLVGQLGVAIGFTKRTAIDKRKTFLSWRIREGRKAI